MEPRATERLHGVSTDGGRNRTLGCGSQVARRKLHSHLLHQRPENTVLDQVGESKTGDRFRDWLSEDGQERRRSLLRSPPPQSPRTSENSVSEIAELA